MEADSPLMRQPVSSVNPRLASFTLAPRRWVVERTFTWPVRSRRLSKNYERKPISSEAQVYFASSRLLLRQICNNQTPYKMTVG